MRRFIHGLGTVLLFVGLIYVVISLVVVFQALTPPFTELGNGLLVFAILLGFGALTGLLGENLRRWSDGKPGFFKQCRIDRDIARRSRELQAADGDAPLAEASRLVRRTPNAPEEDGPLVLASEDVGYWTVIVPYLALPLRDGEYFYLFETEVAAKIFIIALERPELTPRQLKGDALSRELAEYLGCGYKSAILKRDFNQPFRTPRDRVIEPGQLRERYGVPPMERLGHILPQTLYRVHCYLNQLNSTARTYPNGAPDEWHKHLANYKGDVIRRLAASELCLPMQRGEGSNARFSIPSAQMPDGRRYAALFTDQFAIDRYMGVGMDSVVLPKLLSDVAGELRSGKLGPAEGIMINPGREELKITPEEVAEQVEWLDQSSDHWRLYREAPPRENAEQIAGIYRREDTNE